MGSNTHIPCCPYIRPNKGYGHVSRSSGLAKTVLKGTEDGRRSGRQRKRWKDGVRKWTGLEFAKSQRAVENRENGGNLVVIYGASTTPAVMRQVKVKVAHTHTFDNGKSLQNEILKVRNQVQERSRASVGEIQEVCVIGWS